MFNAQIVRRRSQWQAPLTKYLLIKMKSTNKDLIELKAFLND